MLVLVPTVRTTVPMPDFISALIKAWYDIYHTPPSKSQVGVIYAQFGVETGLSAACWNYNIGNIKAVDSPGKQIEYVRLKGVWEIINGQRIIIPPENPGAWFRAFPTLDAGVAWYMSFLRNTRYRVAWGAVEAGNPAGFSHLLKQQGYYTASEASYTQAMLVYFNRFMADPIFFNVLPVAMAQLDQISFPPDYTPINLDVGDKAFDNSNFTNVSSNIFSTWFNKVKGIFGK